MSTWYDVRLRNSRAVILPIEVIAELGHWRVLVKSGGSIDAQRDIRQGVGEDERRLYPTEAEARAFARELLNRVKARCAAELVDAEKQLAALDK